MILCERQIEEYIAMKKQFLLYLLVLLGFGVAAGVCKQYTLAAVELGITFLLLLVHLLHLTKQVQTA